MKKLIASVIALVAFNSFAASIPLLETSNFSSGRATGTYGINEDMGRAWVEVEVDTGFSGDDSSSSTYTKVAVPGMSLVGDLVVLNVEGQQVECARVRPVGIFHYRVAKATGNCKVVAKIEKRIQDDGFETRRVSVLVVNLDTK